jgi:para-nitrobenzyl esterase
MKRLTNLSLCTLAVLLGITIALGAPSGEEQIKTDKGVVEGSKATSGIRIFRGIPFAAPPVGDLRWKAPQPVKSWTGVRSTTGFGDNCMQRPIYGNMGFRSKAMSEDCLYLNVWTPADAAAGKLPVLVYFFGGGLAAGDGSEPRYDGESMATKGIVAVTVNYRLTAFGFMAHPGLTAEAPYHASGNYGFLDQVAALKWVQANIAAFGGDPKRVTIAGQSAGSRSVSIHLLSPLSKNLFAGAIMESGTITDAKNPPSLAEGEKDGLQFMTMAGATTLKDLRGVPATQLLELTAKPDAPKFNALGDNYLLPATDLIAYMDAGKQAHVPVLQGTNSEEESYPAVLKDNPHTPEGFAAAVRKIYGADADRVLAVYPGVRTEDQVLDAAMTLGSEQGQGYRQFLLGESHLKSSGKSVYRYLYMRPRKRFLGAANQTPGTAGGIMTVTSTTPARPPARGAVHSAEIEYVMGNLATNTRFNWEPADYKLSELMEGYFANFIKTGNPNGSGLAKWPAYSPTDSFQIMYFDAESHARPEAGRPRYLVFDQIFRKQATPAISGGPSVTGKVTK